jgi:hypothetical protein
MDELKRRGIVNLLYGKGESNASKKYFSHYRLYIA